ncbi:MAG: PepSY-like domain-containing protein [Tidjanibacter sp.]|nr:PepSY-like domain-containing protein [Tidjanibacter sp.]
MKKFLAFLASAVIVPVGLMGCEVNDEFNVQPNNLPEKAQTFIETHFADTTVRQAVKEYDDLTYTYDVYLADGTQIEFKKNGEWKSINNRRSGVPSSVLPEEMNTYLSTTYEGLFVVDIERDWQYDVELSNGVDLDFSLAGKFIRVDY